MDTANLSPVIQPRLWKEEIGILRQVASEVPLGGRLLEIGTADGATTRLLAEATAGKDVKIVTVDPFPSPLAYGLTKGFPIEIIKATSADAAVSWKEKKRDKVDFIFIDGSHQFFDVFSDFNSWIGLVKPGGTVVFHDYDPVSRGGLAHLGVRIVAESIEREGLLGNVRHEAKLFIGKVNEKTTGLSLNACFKTWRNIEQAVDKAIADFGSDHNRALASLRERKPFYDSVTACRILNHYLASAYAELDSQASDPDDFRRKTEILWAMAHGFQDPWDLPKDAEKGFEALDFSRLIERHQVRNRLLSGVLGLFVTWNV